MMSEHIFLKKNPKIEFQLQEHGFELFDGQTEQNSGFYAYHELQSIDLNCAWYPRFAKWLRIITWIMNGVPFYPDGETCKQANLMIQCRKTKLGIWLTDPYMANKAKRIKEVLDQKTQLPVVA